MLASTTLLKLIKALISVNNLIPIIMVLDKSALIDQINFIITKRIQKGKSGLQKVKQDDEILLEDEEQDEMLRKLQRNWGTSLQEKKIEQRIKELEELNDYLFSFIYFLYENLQVNIDTLPPLPEKYNQKQTLTGVNGDDLITEQCNCKENLPCPTRREKEVLNLLIEGFCAKEIARLLFISESTVITHKKNLKEKFKAKNTAELISKSYDLLTKK